MTPHPTNVPVLLERLVRAAERRGLAIDELGFVGGAPILLLRPKITCPGPQLLVAAGFHGEEPAGCWGVLHHLESSDHDEGVNVSFLPLVNPTGIRAGRRENDWAENPNCDFCHTESGVPSPSREGKILLDAIDRLLPRAHDGFLSLHEDIDLDRFYVYSFEQSTAPGSFSKALVDVESQFFEPVSDGPFCGAIVCGGVIFSECDGSFEDFLFHNGVPRTACTETPGALPFEKRVQANSAIIRTFRQFHSVQT